MSTVEGFQVLMVIPNEGKIWFLQKALKDRVGVATNYRVSLFKNNETVADDSTTIDFVIADFTGYADVVFDSTDWDDAIEALNLGIIVLSLVPTFDSTDATPQTVYGWIMIDDDDGIVICGQNFDTPRVMVASAREALDPFRIESKTFT